MRFRIRGTHLLALALALMPATAAAKEKKPAGDSLADVTKEVKTSISKGDVTAAKAALARALQVRSRHPDKKLKGLVSAVGVGVKHKNPEIAVASIQTLASLNNLQVDSVIHPGQKLIIEITRT